MGTTGIGVTHAERKEVMSSCNLLCLVPTTDHQMDKEGYNGQGEESRVADLNDDLYEN